MQTFDKELSPSQERQFIQRVCADLLYRKATLKTDPTSYGYLLHMFHQHPWARTLLTSIGSPKLLRTLARHPPPSEVKRPKEPAGRLIGLYCRPSPTEQQARIAAENIADKWSEFLWESHHFPCMQVTPTRMLLFVPEGASFALEGLWNEFLNEALFSPQNLLRSLLPLLNLSKLSARGFSAPEILPVSLGMKKFMGAWFFRVFLLVENRLERRQRSLDSETLTEKETQKQQELQNKEVDKYDTHFEKRLNSVQADLEKHQSKLEKLESSIAKLKKPSGSKYEKLIKEREFLQNNPPFPQDAWTRLTQIAKEEGFDPFKTIRREFRENPHIYSDIQQLSKKFNRTAADQLNHPRGDIFATTLLELLKSANTQDEDIIPIPPMFSEQPVLSQYRTAGDHQKNVCFSCGTSIEAGEPSYEIRRMIFTSPEQRLQSSSGPVKPQCCISCAAYSYVCGAKPTDDTTIIKISPQDPSTQTASELTRQMTRTLVSKELNIQAGPYLLLACKEWIKAKGGYKPVSSSIGSLAYTYYRLAKDLHPASFTQMRFYSCEQGKETPLSNAALLWIHALCKASGLGILEQGSLSAPMSKLIRSALHGDYIEAEYIAATHTNLTTTFQRTLEPFRQDLLNTLEQE